MCGCIGGSEKKAGREEAVCAVGGGRGRARGRSRIGIAHARRACRSLCRSFLQLTYQPASSTTLLHSKLAYNFDISPPMGDTGRAFQRTFWPLLLNQPLKQEVQRLASYLPRKHEEDLDFARRPY